MGIKWSRGDDVTWPWKVKVEHPICLGPSISETAGWQWSTYGKWPPGNRMVTWPITSRDFEWSTSRSRYVWCPISRKWLEIETRWQEHLYDMATWESNGHVIDDTWNYRKTANIIEKTSVYHTVNGNRAPKTAKMIKVILLSSTLIFWQGALSNTVFIIFAVFDARLPLTAW